MRGIVVFLLVCMLAITIAALVDASRASEDNSCQAPCVVEFPQGTQEDEFNIDWHDHTVHVFKVTP